METAEYILKIHGIINRDFALTQPKPFTTDTLHMQVSGDKYEAIIKAMEAYKTQSPSQPVAPNGLQGGNEMDIF